MIMMMMVMVMMMMVMRFQQRRLVRRLSAWRSADVDRLSAWRCADADRLSAWRCADADRPCDMWVAGRTMCARAMVSRITPPHSW